MNIVLTEDHNFEPPGLPGTRVAYKKGRGYSVKRTWGELLIARGVATEARAKRRAPGGGPEKAKDERG